MTARGLHYSISGSNMSKQFRSMVGAAQGSQEGLLGVNPPVDGSRASVGRAGSPLPPGPSFLGRASPMGSLARASATVQSFSTAGASPSAVAPLGRIEEHRKLNGSNAVRSSPGGGSSAHGPLSVKQKLARAAREQQRLLQETYAQAVLASPKAAFGDVVRRRELSPIGTSSQAFSEGPRGAVRGALTSPMRSSKGGAPSDLATPMRSSKGGAPSDFGGLDGRIKGGFDPGMSDPGGVDRSQPGQHSRYSLPTAMKRHGFHDTGRTPVQRHRPGAPPVGISNEASIGSLGSSMGGSSVASGAAGRKSPEDFALMPVPGTAEDEEAMEAARASRKQARLRAIRGKTPPDPVVLPSSDPSFASRGSVGRASRQMHLGLGSSQEPSQESGVVPLSRGLTSVSRGVTSGSRLLVRPRPSVVDLGPVIIPRRARRQSEMAREMAHL